MPGGAMVAAFLSPPVLAAAAVLLLPFVLRSLASWRSVIARLWTARRLPGPPAPPGLLGLLLGHTTVVVAHTGCFYLLLEEWTRTYGPVFALRFMWSTVVVCADPSLFGPLLRSGPQKLEKYMLPYKRLERLIHPPSPSMLTRPEDAHWRVVRKAVAPAFQTANLRGAFGPMAAVLSRVVGELRALGPSTPFDADDVAQRLTIDVIGEFGFARDFGAGRLGSRQEALEAVRHVTVALQALNNPLNRYFPWRKAPRELQLWGSRLHRLVDRLLTEMEADRPPPHTLAAHVMGIRDAWGRPLPRASMIAELALLWGAGFETTAHTLSWALFLVATHPEVEAAVLDELSALGLAAAPAAEARALEWGDIGRLRRVAAVVQEAMRLFPVVSTGTGRCTHAPIDLGGHKLCAGMPILLPTWAVHRSPCLWERPNEFLPFERWLGGGDDAASLQAGCCDDSRSSAGGDGAAGHRASSAAGDSPKRHRSSSRGGGGGRGPEPVWGSPAVSQPGAMMAFSLGTRSCVGQGLAVLELRAALAVLLGHFSFELAPGVTREAVAASATQAITLRPNGGLWMVARHRSELPGGRSAVAPGGGAGAASAAG